MCEVRSRSHDRFVCLLFAVGGISRLKVNAAPTNQYEEVRDWPKLPPGVQLGEVAGVAVDVNDHVFIFHRPGRGFDTSATEKLKEPAVLEVDAGGGKLIASWGANAFLVPHGVTIDGANNVFLTDVSLQQVFKFTHDGKVLDIFNTDSDSAQLVLSLDCRRRALRL